MSEISDKVMKLKEKVIDNICWSKNGAVSLSYFLAFPCFFTPVSLEVSSFLSEVSKAEQITGTFRGICSSSCVCFRTKDLRIHHLILSLQQYYELDIVAPILQQRKLRLDEVQQFTAVLLARHRGHVCVRARSVMSHSL